MYPILYRSVIVNSRSNYVILKTIENMILLKLKIIYPNKSLQYFASNIIILVRLFCIIYKYCFLVQTFA